MIEILTHNISPITAITFSDKYIAIARGQFIEIWDIIQSNPLRKVIKDEDIINNIIINQANTKLIIASRNIIKVIEIKTGKIIQSFDDIHNSKITTITLSNKYLITSDIDFNIIIWNLKENNFKQLKDNQKINRIQIIDNKEFVTFNKKTKKIWNIEKLELVNSFNLKSCITELITINNKNYAFNSDNKFIYFRDIDENESIFQPNQELLYKIATNSLNFHTIQINAEYYFISIDKNNIIYLWNINKKQLLKSFVFFNDRNFNI